MVWGKKKEDPPKKEPARTPGRSTVHKHNYHILVSDVTTWQQGHRRRTVTHACDCGLTNSVSS
jgi:hypothetical protein